MQYCAKHLTEIKHELTRRNLWRFVSELHLKKQLNDWCTGLTRPENLNPMVVLMLEIGAKSARMFNPLLPAKTDQNGLKGDVSFALMMSHCPLCIIPKLAKKADADIPVLRNGADMVLQLMIANQRIVAEAPDPKPELLPG